MRATSVSAIVSSIKQRDVEGVFCVTSITMHGPPSEYVILLRNRGYYCTCSLQENSGYPCKHFFFMMKMDGRFMFHPALVMKRWFLVKHQIDPRLRMTLQNTVFIRANTKDARGVGARRKATPVYPRSSFLDRSAVFAPAAVPSAPRKTAANTKRYDTKILKAAKDFRLAVGSSNMDSSVERAVNLLCDTISDVAGGIKLVNSPLNNSTRISARSIPPKGKQGRPTSKVTSIKMKKKRPAPWGELERESKSVKKRKRKRKGGRS